MIKKIIPFVLAAGLLVSCNQSHTKLETVSVVSPLGAPSVAFYDQGSSEKWTSENAANLPGRLKGNDFDAVVFDSITGLSLIKKDNLDFALAKVITGGNFHLIGINTAEKPTDESRIVAFQQDKVPDKVFKKLAKERWGLTDAMHVEYVPTDVKDTAAVLKSGKYNAQPVDYVLSAEPVISKISKQTLPGVTLTEIYDLRAEWKLFSGQDAIVQAGVFVRKSSISSKKDSLSDFMRKLEARVEDLTKTGENAANAMHTFSEDETLQENRFGINESLVKELQNEGRNRLGFVDPKANIDVNAFLTALGQGTFTDDYFVTL